MTIPSLPAEVFADRHIGPDAALETANADHDHPSKGTRPDDGVARGAPPRRGVTTWSAGSGRRSGRSIMIGAFRTPGPTSPGDLRPTW